MKLSIIIPTIKPAAELQPQVNAIHKSLKGYNDYEIIIQSANQSAARNRNAGLYKSKGDYVIQCDDDIEKYPPAWAFNLIAPLNNIIRIISARLMTPQGTPATMISFKGKINNNQDVWINPDGLLPSACFAFSRDTWEGVKNNPALPYNKPFDERYIYACGEDADFCMAVLKTFSGAQVAVNNRVKIIHREESKWRTDNPRDWQVNHELFTRKWGRPPH